MNLGRRGYVGVIRTSSGEFVEAVCASLFGNFDSLLTEEISLRKVLSWLKNSNPKKIVEEIDSQSLILAVNSCFMDCFC